MQHNLDNITLHASSVEVKDFGVLIIGDSCGGKSDLALRLIDRDAKLVSDDQTTLKKFENSITASCPDNIKGLIEVRGLGILKLPYKENSVIKLVVILSSRDNIERLPYPESYEILGVDIPKIRIFPFDVAAALKIEMAVLALIENNMVSGAFVVEN
jgi:HPr kinase/phosphorylase